MAKESDKWKEFRQYLHECGMLEELEAICRRRFQSLREVHGRAKGPGVIQARAECFVWMIEETGRGIAETARIWGRDHGTVMVAIRRHRERARTTNGLSAQGENGVRSRHAEEAADS